MINNCINNTFVLYLMKVEHENTEVYESYFSKHEKTDNLSCFAIHLSKTKDQEHSTLQPSSLHYKPGFSLT